MRVGEGSAIAIIQVACGFSRRPQHNADYRALSPVDAARAEAVRARHRPGNQVWVTGMVPYESGNRDMTLANINADRMTVSYGVPQSSVSCVPGLNAFSESWNACQMAREQGVKRIVVVSSDFYFEAYRRMWLAAGKRNGLVVEITELSHNDLVAPKVWDFYKGFKAQTLSKVAASSTFGHLLAKTLADRMTAKRATEGFKIDGHTSIG